jgi:predicted transcriptional regulator of viral defense system
MKWPELLSRLGREPVFSAALLQTGDVSRRELSIQLSRWVRSGRLIQLRRGVYAIARPYRQVEPHPFLVANALRKNSYVSLQSALAFHGLIPEHVPACTSVTTGRSEKLETPMGTYIYKRAKPDYLFGFRQMEVASNQFAFVADPEKALLDLVYVTKGAQATFYLRELRLQHTDAISGETLEELAARMNTPKLRQAARVMRRLLEEEKGSG